MTARNYTYWYQGPTTLRFLNTSWIYDEDDYNYDYDYDYDYGKRIEDALDNVVLNATAANISTTTPGDDVVELLAAAGDDETKKTIVEAVFKSLVLASIVVLTIGGNVLVLLAVFMSRNLRSSTHYLIVNLAVADLLLGTTVLPFSATLEVSGKWYFGQIFCEVWATADVLCCTASIWSLCVISLDRYVGVTRPLAYSTIMTEKRMCVLIGAVWVLSIVISIGPAFGWKTPPDPDPTVCTVNQQLGYVLFSVTGSFYLPSLCILLLYWRIYRAAIEQSKFLESGIKTTKTSVTLRVHKGGAKKGETIMTLRAHRGGGMGVGIAAGMAAGLATGVGGLHGPCIMNGESKNSSPLSAAKSRFKMHRRKREGLASLMAPPPHLQLAVTSLNWQNNPNHEEKEEEGVEEGGSCRPLEQQNEHWRRKNHQDQESPSSSPERRIPGPPGKMAKFRRQKKAAKTLGIVVGVFLLCWFPFFFILPLDSLCGPCNISETLFGVFFWLGYFNSCLNPFIYACTSRDFKRAFKRILCRGRPRRTLHHTSTFHSAVWRRETTVSTARTPSPARHGLEGLLAHATPLADPYGAMWKSQKNLKPHEPAGERLSAPPVLH
ncbi:alpha-1A adrenergic receptor-like [Palaemon carinicauda]|uniref:alpha-1A adrenergic receptor-like n=1 Tax=Palaemon carinicauda TaxID=392227 RepID=UPI0035B66F7E